MKKLITLLVIVGSLSTSWALSPAEIIAKVEAKYTNMTTYSSEGTVISSLARYGSSFVRKTTNSFVIKLAKPYYYRVEWSQPLGEFSRDGMAWGDGQGDFVMQLDEGTCRVVGSKEEALNSSLGVSSGASSTVPNVFFNEKKSFFKEIKDFTSEKDETIDGDDCYAISGTLGGQKIIFWISKKDFLIRQRQLVLGNPKPVTDDEVKDALKDHNEPNTPEAFDKTKKILAQIRLQSQTMQGTMTEKQQKVQVDKPLRKEDYVQNLPKGVRLIEH